MPCINLPFPRQPDKYSAGRNPVARHPVRLLFPWWLYCLLWELKESRAQLASESLPSPRAQLSCSSHRWELLYLPTMGQVPSLLLIATVRQLVLLSLSKIPTPKKPKPPCPSIFRDFLNTFDFFRLLWLFISDFSTLFSLSLHLYSSVLVTSTHTHMIS